RDEGDLVRRDPQLREEVLDRGQDRVVAAAGTPPDLLVAGEVLAGERGGSASPAGRLAGRPLAVRIHRHRSSSSRIASSISWAKNGRPCTFWKLLASTRNRPRISRASWPRFISGIRTRG